MKADKWKVMIDLQRTNQELIEKWEEAKRTNPPLADHYRLPVSYNVLLGNDQVITALKEAVYLLKDFTDLAYEENNELLVLKTQDFLKKMGVES